MRLRRDKNKILELPVDQPVSDQTRSALNSAIVNIVQAIGSKAGVLVFWDETRRAPGHISSYGLSSELLDELNPVIGEVIGLLQQRLAEFSQENSVSRGDEMPALQLDVPTSSGSLHLLCLPIQSEGRFIAGLCLLQPTSLGLPLLDEAMALPPSQSGLGAGVIPDREEDDGLYQSQQGLTIDRSDLVARNARLLKRLVEERQWLGLVIEYSADGILIVDSLCNIIGFNPAFARLCGWNLEELRGQNCYESLKITSSNSKDYCGHHCPIRLGTFINKPEDERRTEVELTTKDGGKRDVELTYSVIQSPDRRILGGIIGARDITARKEAEELQSTFLSVISHELQTPIAIIKGYAGLYADETTKIDPDKMREKMQIIQEESERLSKLVDNLLYASRLQAGGIELSRHPVEVAALLRRVVAKMQGVSPAHPIRLQLPPEELPAVLADYDKIQQVLVNLVENAIKYSPTGGPISLSAEPTSQEVIISVTDHGIGIAVAERQRIFDRFSRLDSRYVRERKGAGLGLYICKAIVEAHGGRIWVEAAPDNDQAAPGGSRFNFSLPRDEPAHLPVLFGKI